MRGYVQALASGLFGQLAGAERATLWFQGETSDFVRFNHAKVRQAGRVEQRELTLRLVAGGRVASIEINLGGDEETDRNLLLHSLQTLRARLSILPEDPHLLIAWDAPSVERLVTGDAPPVDQVVQTVAAGGAGLDLVGIYGGGQVQRGFWSSTGVHHWFSTPSWTLDWSFHLAPRAGERRAVKMGTGGTQWTPAPVLSRMEAGRRQLDALEKPIHPLTPGEVRAWLSQDAVSEILSLASYGFSAMACHTRDTAWSRQLDGHRLHPGVSISEATGQGVGPPFQSDGFVKPDQVPLIEAGAMVGRMVSPRSALELGIPATGASDQEMPEALCMAPGTLPESDVYKRIGTGLYVSNLWYCNVSDRSSGRITGLTRFATLWVENGEPVGPVPTMRFDDTLSRMLGSELEEIGASADLLPSNDSWGWRSTACSTLPGVLLKSFRLTL